MRPETRGRAKIYDGAGPSHSRSSGNEQTPDASPVGWRPAARSRPSLCATHRRVVPQPAVHRRAPCWNPWSSPMSGLNWRAAPCCPCDSENHWPASRRPCLIDKDASPMGRSRRSARNVDSRTSRPYWLAWSSLSRASSRHWRASRNHSCASPRRWRPGQHPSRAGWPHSRLRQWDLPSNCRDSHLGSPGWRALLTDSSSMAVDFHSMTAGSRPTAEDSRSTAADSRPTPERSPNQCSSQKQCANAA